MAIDFEKYRNTFLQGLNINPVPMEFSQSLSTGEWLASLQGLIEGIATQNEEIALQAFDKYKTQLDGIIATVDTKTSNAYILDNFLTYINDYATTAINQLIGDGVKYVTFGLTSDGHFTATIPDSWNTLEFDTNVDSTSVDYGKLMIEF